MRAPVKGCILKGKNFQVTSSPNGFIAWSKDELRSTLEDVVNRRNIRVIGEGGYSFIIRVV